MSELIGRKLLDTTDAFLVEELHIVAGIAIEEVVSTHAEPEQVEFLIRISGIVVDVGNIGRRKRAVRAEVRELVEIRQTIEEALVATT